MSRADDEKLSGLHGQLADALATGIRESDPDAKGYASLLNVARQFLKDNHIESTVTKDNPLGTLVDSIPEFDDEVARH